MRLWDLFRRPEVRAEPLATGATTELSERPRSVRELLTEMKDISEQTLDLAWAALAFDSREIADEVQAMSLRSDRLLYEIRIAVMLAARDRRSAEQLAGLLQVANAAEDLAEAADEITQLLDSDIAERLELPFMLNRADELMRTIPVEEGERWVMATMRDLLLESSTGVRVVALRRRDRWQFRMNGSTRMRIGDLLMCRGTEDGFTRLREYIGGDAEKQADDSNDEASESTPKPGSSVNLFLAMKEMSELMVDLAYSSLLFDSEGVATEVYYLNEEMDDSLYELQRRAVEGVAATASPDSDIEVVSPDRALGLMRLGSAVEAIAAAARSIADATLRDIDPHPVLAESVRDSDSAVLRVHLAIEDPGDNGIEWVGIKQEHLAEAIGAMRLASITGLWVLAIRRKGTWIYEIDQGTHLEANDVVLLRGPEEGLERLRTLLSQGNLE